MLSRNFGSGPQALFAIAPDAPCAAQSSRECSYRDNRDRNRHTVRILAIRTVCRRIQGPVWGIPLRDARSAARIANAPTTRRPMTSFGAWRRMYPEPQLAQALIGQDGKRQ